MKTFPALYGRQSGLLEIQRNRLTFTSDDDPNLTFILSPRHLEITMGGQNSHHYYLKDPHQPELVLCIQNEGALHELAAVGCLQAKGMQYSAQKRKALRALIFGSPFVLAILLVLSIPFTFSFIPISWLNDLLSYQQERKLGELLFPAIRKEFKIVDQHAAQSQVEKLVGFLKNGSSELHSLQFQVHITEGQDLNAFALPGGIIVVNQGLLRKAESVEEVLGVLAHEMAHVERRHLVKSLAGRMGSLAGVVLLSFFVGPDAAVVIGQTSDFLTLRYSRADESEADQQGFYFLKNAGIPANGMIHFFSKLDAENKLIPTVSFLSTHPLSKERVQALQRLADENPITSPLKAPVSIEELKQ